MLPVDVLVHILENLEEVDDIINASLVSTYFHKVCHKYINNNLYIKSLCFESWQAKEVSKITTILNHYIHDGKVNLCDYRAVLLILLVTFFISLVIYRVKYVNEILFNRDKILVNQLITNITRNAINLNNSTQFNDFLNFVATLNATMQNTIINRFEVTGILSQIKNMLKTDEANLNVKNIIDNISQVIAKITGNVNLVKYGMVMLFLCSGLYFFRILCLSIQDTNDEYQATLFYKNSYIQNVNDYLKKKNVQGVFIDMIISSLKNNLNFLSATRRGCNEKLHTTLTQLQDLSITIKNSIHANKDTFLNQKYLKKDDAIYEAIDKTKLKSYAKLISFWSKKNPKYALIEEVIDDRLQVIIR